MQVGQTRAAITDALNGYLAPGALPNHYALFQNEWAIYYNV